VLSDATRQAVGQYVHLGRVLVQFPAELRLSRGHYRLLPAEKPRKLTHLGGRLQPYLVLEPQRRVC
jgi:hypothetical protein